LPLYKLYRVCCDNLLVREKVRPEAIVSTEKLLDSYVAEEVVTLEEGLNFLSVTSTISPFLGLLGTVWGIMVMFRRMTQTGSSTISTVAPGISVALTTTIAGLVVAIPAAIFYYYFRGRVNKQLVLMEKFSRELITKLQHLILEEQDL
jgi:biopolymer transport protein TolQ